MNVFTQIKKHFKIPRVNAGCRRLCGCYKWLQTRRQLPLFCLCARGVLLLRRGAGVPMGNVEVVQGGLFLPSGDYVFEVLWSRIVGEGLADKEPTLELGLKVISGQFKGSQITERFAIKANPLRIGYGSKAHALVKATIGVSKARQDDGFHPVRSFPRRRFSGFLVAQEASQGVYLRRGTIAPPPRGVNPVAASKLTVLKMVRKPQATEVKAGV